VTAHEFYKQVFEPAYRIKMKALYVESYPGPKLHDTGTPEGHEIELGRRLVINRRIFQDRDWINSICKPYGVEWEVLDEHNIKFRDPKLEVAKS